MVDTDQIFKLLTIFFTIQGPYQIDPDTGEVHVQGRVQLTKSMDQIPIQFATVSGDFQCVGKSLTTLKGAPREVGRHFQCSYNNLKDLKYAPHTVGAGFFCQQNPLVSLEGAPESIQGPFVCDYSPHLPLLRTLNSKGPITLLSALWEGSPQQVVQILNRNVGAGKPGAIKAAAELIRAGFKENARW